MIATKIPRCGTSKNTQGLSQKIQAIYFKIQGTYFKTYALYFSRLQISEKECLLKTVFLG